MEKLSAAFCGALDGRGLVGTVSDEATALLVRQARDPTASLAEQHAAFVRLLEESQHVVFAIAMSSLRDADDAKDAAQDSFVIAWRRLRKLRDPAAFQPWLRSIVVRECARRHRRRARESSAIEPPECANPSDRDIEYQQLVAAALSELSAGERNVTVLFYFLGYSQAQIGKLLGLKPGTVGKRLHSARLRIRRRLPRSIRSEFVRDSPSVQFATRVRNGLLDEYVGDYRFDGRPDHVVTITRAGDSLVGESRGQRNIIAAIGDESLVTKEYDGEGRFRRGRSGEVTHFVYYEFGRRLGIARKIARADAVESSA